MNARCSKRQCTFEHHETFYENVNIHIYTTHSSTSQLFVLSTLGLKCKERPFHVLVSKSGMRRWMKNFVKEILPLRNKVSSYILKTKDFYIEPDEIMLTFKQKTETNWLNKFYNILSTHGNQRTILFYNERLSFSFFFSCTCIFQCLFLCYVSISALFPVQFNQFKFNFVK